jgi:hypothetical protein
MVTRTPDKPFQVKARGTFWWYQEAALKLADSTSTPEVAAPVATDGPTALPVPAATAGGDVSSAVVGSLVVLAADFGSYSDASGGPLTLGQVGVVVQTSDTRLQVKVHPSGDQEWW